MKEYILKFNKFITEDDQYQPHEWEKKVSAEEFNKIFRLELEDGMYFFTISGNKISNIKLYDDPSLTDFSGKTLTVAGKVVNQQPEPKMGNNPVTEEDNRFIEDTYKKYDLEDRELTDEEEEEILNTISKNGPRSRYVVTIYYDVMVPDTGDSKHDKKLAKELANNDSKRMKNSKTTIGEIDFVRKYH